MKKKSASTHINLATVAKPEPKVELDFTPVKDTNVRDFTQAQSAKREREEEQEKDSAWDDLEIPAFLRRQAN
jgi:hypothetical protein